jgi:hypothetical protein
VSAATDKKAKARDAGGDPIALLMADLGDNDALQLLEQSDKGERPRYIDTINNVDGVRELGPEEYLRQHHGGGTWILRVRRRGTGTYGKQATLSIAGERKRSSSSSNGNGNGAHASNGNGKGESMMERVLLAVAVPVATAVGAAIAKKFLESPAPPNSLEDVAKVAKLFSGGGGLDTAAALQLVETARANGVELGKQLADAKESGHPVADVIRDLAPPLLSLMTRDLNARTGNGAGPAVAVPAGAPGASGPGASPGATAPAAAPLLALPAGYEWVERVVPYAPQLVNLAAANKAPALYADFVLDQIPGDVYDAVDAVAPREDFVATVVTALETAAPALTPYHTWVTGFFAEVRSILTAPDDETPAP